MIQPRVTKSRVKMWRLGKDGFVSENATLLESVLGSKIVYDNPIPEKDYHARCDVCLVQEQGYACDRIAEAPGPYEYEGGCMDCKYMCRKSPIHIGVRNYCSEHVHILNRKLGMAVC
jgi:hypothetical protein